jgi:hypothetical protein
MICSCVRARDSTRRAARLLSPRCFAALLLRYARRAPRLLLPRTPAFVLAFLPPAALRCWRLAHRATLGKSENRQASNKAKMA